MKLVTRAIVFWVLIGCALLALQFATPSLAEEWRSALYLGLILLVAVYILTSVLTKRKGSQVSEASLEQVEQAILHERDKHHP